MEYPADIVQTIKVPRGYRYAFVYIAPQHSKQTLLFLPGFPEAAYDWHYQVEHFRSLGYGIIAPDLLGYGLTDKPTDHTGYRMKSMASDVVAILDHLGIEQVIGVGHDWGAGLLAALSAYFPARFVSYTFAAVGYAPPGRIDADQTNRMTKQYIGYEAFGYFQFFGEPGAAQIMDKNFESVNALLYSEEEEGHWPKNVCPPGAARSWLSAGKVTPLPNWFKQHDLEAKNRILRQGYTGPTAWYKQAAEHFNDEDAKTAVVQGIPDKPVLYLSDTRQAAMPADMMEGMVRQHCANVTVKKLSTSHWQMLEDPQGFNEALEAFLHETGL